MLLDAIFQAAKSDLAGKKVKDAIIGLSIIAVQLDSGEVGTSYVLREELAGGCSMFPRGLAVIGLDAVEVGQWLLNEKNILKRALAIATINACSRKHYNRMPVVPRDYMDEIKPTDVVGMIGHIGPVIHALQGKTKDFIIFDKGRNSGDGITAQEAQQTLLPTCDVVFVSGTTFINNTIDEVLAMCSNAREVIIIGSSTMMYPEAYQDSRISIIAGSFWQEAAKEEIFKTISLAGGILNLVPYMEKVSARV